MKNFMYGLTDVTSTTFVGCTRIVFCRVFPGALSGPFGRYPLSPVAYSSTSRRRSPPSGPKATLLMGRTAIDGVVRAWRAVLPPCTEE